MLTLLFYVVWLKSYLDDGKMSFQDKLRNYVVGICRSEPDIRIKLLQPTATNRLSHKDQW